MIEKIDRLSGDGPDFDDMKEFATEQLYVCIREVKSSPDMAQPVEVEQSRRTPGLSENLKLLKTRSSGVTWHTDP
jgi:hypothetical protein